MARDNHHRCDRCGVLLALSYPWPLCPKHWRQEYGAPPGEFSPWYRPADTNQTRTELFETTISTPLAWLRAICCVAT